MGERSYKNRLLDVRKDRLDLRDRLYRPLLRSLPAHYPNVEHLDELIQSYRKNQMILDQGSTGACTGYALASVINYLLWRAHGSEIKVSPKMLFNLARIYDEWDGEDYQGSSCRGAMKGWHKHGVCPECYWSFKEDEPKEGWERASVEYPLGAYYRVEKGSIADIQSALCEVGALYASASIHDGWWKVEGCQSRDGVLLVEEDLPKIQYDPFPQGNHAFVIVGYTRYGFIVQNSWGESWGNCGFALLSYEDWLANGLDIWVAVMGVPVEIERTPMTISSEALTSLKPYSGMVQAINVNEQKRAEEQAYEHTLILNANGRAKHTIISANDLDHSMEIISYINLKKWLEHSDDHRKVVIYALSGLDNEKESIAKIKRLIPYFLNNGIYPIFLTWRESYVGAIVKAIKDHFEQDKIIAKNDIDKEALNRAIENYGKAIALRGIWSEIRGTSRRACAKRIRGFSIQKSGVLYVLTNAIKRLSQYYPIELHAITHSAGAQLLVTSGLNPLIKEGIVLRSLHLIAPTVALEDAYPLLFRADRVGILKKRDLHIYMLDGSSEEDDHVGLYQHSLLYLISRSLEQIHKTPLLGLAESWEDLDLLKEKGIFTAQQLKIIKRWQRFALTEEGCSTHLITKKDDPLFCSVQGEYIELSHINLDRSIKVLETILNHILFGKAEGKLSYTLETLC